MRYWESVTIKIRDSIGGFTQAEFMSPIQIIPVSTRQHRNDFFAMRQILYKDNPAVVHPLDSMARLQLDVDKHPFYQHATREMFVAYIDNRPVGRIVAIIDRMQQEHNQNRIGCFGFFESVDDQAVVDALLAAAEGWLAERGCDQIQGPMDPSMKAEFGVLVDGQEESPMIMTAYNFARYRQQLIDCGFDPVREFHCYNFYSNNPPEEQWARLFKSRDRIFDRFPQLSFRSVEAATFEKTMRDINELGNQVRSEGWGFVPLTDAELAFMIKNLRRVIRYDMIHVAYWEDRLVGYIVNIPDVNWALRNTKGKWDILRMLQLPRLLKKCPRTRVIALGVDQEFRTKGIAMLLIARLVEKFKAFDEWEFSWVDSENKKSIRAIARALPLLKTRTYQLFQKPIKT